MREKGHQITGRTAAVFASALRAKEYSEGTIANYLRSVRAFAAWSGGRASRSRTAGWKAHLAGSHAPATVNTILAGVNCFFAAMGWEECRVKPLRVQRRSFQDPERELGRERLAAIRAYLLTHGTGRRQDFLELLHVSPEQGTQILSRLVKQGALTLIGRCYRLPDKES